MQPPSRRSSLPHRKPRSALGANSRLTNRTRHTPPVGVRDLPIVDDAADTRELYATYFRFRGFDVVTAPDGDAGIEATVRLKPDVVVMDLAMPRRDGISAAHHLKHHPRTCKIPVVLLTGYGLRAIHEGALETGIDVFLTKPCLPEDLEQHVRTLLARRRL